MRNIKLTLEYDGTAFHGWQIQPEMRTVQGVLEAVLSQLLQTDIQVIGSGRTDAGVHALGQVANFRTTNPLPLERLHKGLNALLPDDVVVHQVETVSPAFHARFDAYRRCYRYRMTYRPVAIGRAYVWYYPYARLDVSQMQTAAQLLLGDHDFQAFCASGSDVAHYRVNVMHQEWQVQEDNLTFEICANRFLRGMVRSLVGTMVAIGRGKMPISQLQEALETGQRNLVGPTAPPQGLYLTQVLYPDDVNHS
ncbi:MAG: tRNA pseudouridine(38-40) synthase TruA [Gemmatimonadetes bacterium]|nr:MAG: tRNA pseudouridine(38-40) synthase TruA [Gemmatimonadota bacterium]